MSTNIINRAELIDVSKSNDILFFPVTLDIEKAKSFDVRYIKIVVLPSVFKTQNDFTLNNPYNLASSDTINKNVLNDNSIEINEVGSDYTPNFYKNIFTKNITTNLLQTYFNKLAVIYPEDKAFDTYINYISRSEISSNLYYKDSSEDSDPELSHFFIVYLLDSYENVIESKFLTPDEDFRIDDYPEASNEVIIEAFLDSISGSLDIEWKDFQFEEKRIIDGPTIKLNFPPQLTKTIINTNINISLKYEYQEFEESFSFFVVYKRQRELNQINIVNPAAEYFSFKDTIKSQFLNNLVSVKSDINIPDEIEDLTDFTSNDFVLNLYKKINENEEGASVEITVLVDDQSFTKDIFINKSNFNYFFTKYLKYNKLFFLKGIFKNFIKAEKIINDVNKLVLALSIKKFDLVKTSLGLLNESSTLSIKVNDIKVQEFYFDDNISLNNSLKPFGLNNEFYLTSLINSSNVNIFYIDKINASSSIELYIDGFFLYDFFVEILPSDLAYIDILSRNNIDYYTALRNTSIIEVEKNIYKNITCELIGNNIEIFFNTSNTINVDLVKERLDIDLTNTDVSENVKYEALVNNMIACLKVSSFNTDREVFIGTAFLLMRDMTTENKKKKIDIVNDLFNNFETSNTNITIDISFYALDKNLFNFVGNTSWDSISDNPIDQVKEKLCRSLYELRPSKFFEINRKIDNYWFSQNSKKEKIINSIGSLLIYSKIDNNFILTKRNVEIKKRKPAKKRIDSKIKKSVISNLKGIENQKIINVITDFSFENISKNIDLNFNFDIDDLISLKRIEKNNKNIYTVNLNNESQFALDIKSENFFSVNVYSLFNLSFNGNYTNYKNVTKYEMNSFGCLLNPDHLDVIKNFKVSIVNNKLSVTKNIKNSLRYNPNFYKIIYSIYNKGLGKLEKIVNRIVFEVNMKNGERVFYAKNIIIDASRKSKLNNNIISKYNLDINIDKEYNIHIDF